MGNARITQAPTVVVEKTTSTARETQGAVVVV